MVDTLRCLLATFAWGFVVAPLWAAEEPIAREEAPSDDRPAAESSDPKLQTPSEPQASDGVKWLGDYLDGVARARQDGRMLLIYFTGSENDARCRRFEDETLSDAGIVEKLGNYVCVRLPLDAEAAIGGESIRLLKHRAFREMVGRPGVAIVDYRSRDAEFYGQVVSTFPLTGKLWYTPAKMRVILDLPPGKLTQRTLIYAVRTHPEGPKSTDGVMNASLTEEAENHSEHQARIRNQGHHQWGSRFNRINRKLRGGLVAAEVCAESWPGENLVEAAVECVRCWRTSSGHWAKVRASQPEFGYDIRRGSNGIWYATGIFGQGR